MFGICDTVLPLPAAAVAPAFAAGICALGDVVALRVPRETSAVGSPLQAAISDASAKQV
jgi:hypothetical protein